MPSINELISNVANLTPLEMANVINENELNDKLKDYAEQNPQDAAYVILHAEQIAINNRDFAGANTLVNQLNFAELNPLQQAHVRRLTGSYLGKMTADHKQSIAHLQQAATLFKQNDNKLWLFNTLFNEIGVLLRFAEANPGQVSIETFTNLYNEIKSLKDYDDKDGHGMIVTSYYLASFYCLINEYAKAKTAFQETKHFEQSRVLNIPPFIAMINSLNEKINLNYGSPQIQKISDLVANPAFKSPIFTSPSVVLEEKYTQNSNLP